MASYTNIQQMYANRLPGGALEHIPSLELAPQSAPGSCEPALKNTQLTRFQAGLTARIIKGSQHRYQDPV